MSELPNPPLSPLRLRLVKLAKWSVLLSLLFTVIGWLSWQSAIAWIVPDYSELVHQAQQAGIFYSRDGRILRMFPNAQEEFLLPSSPASFPLVLRQAFLAAEDRRFYTHGGFDPYAILRSFWLNVSHQRILSGASTITQQLIRMTRPAPRTFRQKIIEIFLAAKLETRMSKEEIFSAYMNLAPMGGNVRGAPLAALVYWNKTLDQVTPAEAATLAAIPQAPTRLDPTRSKGVAALKRRRDWILAEMIELGFLETEEARQAQHKPVKANSRRFPFAAPHFIDWVTAIHGFPKEPVTTTLDLDIQSILGEVLHSHQPRLFRVGAGQAAAMIVDTTNMEVLAMGGSFQFGPLAGGFNNGCTAPRSGGSTLKPFLYALALENGFHACSLIPDTKQDFQTPQGDYLPFNADRQAYGPVTIRSALGNSLNISAVKMLNALGVSSFYDLLVRSGVLQSDPGAIKRLGLGLAIGNPEVRMTDLLPAYGAFARGGTLRPLAWKKDTPASQTSRIFSPGTAFVILDILSDPSARLLTFGNPRYFNTDSPVALKTGTSTDYRDCWIYAITPRFIIGIWAGNFDGRPTFGLSGASACGPVLRDLLERLPKANGKTWFSQPREVKEIPVCGISGQSPTQFCPNVSRELVLSGMPLPPACPFHSSQGHSHELPIEYADWLRQRRLSLQSDPYTLTDGLQTPDPFLILPPSPGETTTGVRVRSGPPESLWKRLICRLFPICKPFWESPVEPAKSSLLTAPSYPETDVSTSPTKIHLGEPDDSFVQIGRINIVHPHDGDQFIMSPGQDNLIRLRAVPQEPLPGIIWMVDGREIARTPPPYETFWALERGRHFISALGPGEQGTVICIQVE